MRITLDTDIPIRNTEGWDGDAARARILEWAGYDAGAGEDERAKAIERAARLCLMRREESDSAGDLVAPCGDVADGEPFLSRAALRYALAAVNGARGGIDAPDDILAKAREMLTALLGEASRSVEIRTAPDGARIARGYAVVWDGADLYGERFTRATDFGHEWFALANPPLLYEHGIHPDIGFAVVGRIKSMQPDDIGLLVEAELDRHSKYLDMIERLAQSGALGMSTGSAGHLVAREGRTITRWPIIEVSLTPAPAEPRTLGVEVAQAIRSLMQSHESGHGQHEAARAPEAIEDGAIRSADSFEVQEEKQMENITATPVVAPTTASATPVYVGQSAPQFGAFVRSVGLHDTSALRAMGAQVGANGGYLVPETMIDELFGDLSQTSIFMKRAYVVNVAGTIRQPVIDVSQSSTDTYAWFGGVKYTWQSENAAIAETEPKLKQYTLRGLALAGITRVSNRLLAASRTDAMLRQLFSASLAAYLDAFFMNGNGAGQPLGILNAPALVTVARGTAGDVKAADVAKMYSRLPSGSANGAVWLVHPTVTEKLIQLAVSNAPVWMPDFRSGVAGTLFGLPVIVTETAKPLGTQGDVVLADLRAYAVQMASSIEIAVSEHAYFEYDQTAYRVTAYADGQPRVADKAKWIGTSTETSPFIALQ